MKTGSQHNQIRAGLGLLRRALGTVGLTTTLVLPAALGAAVSPAGAAPGYTLFVGDDILARSEKAVRPVLAFEGDSVLVRDQSSPKRLSLQWVLAFHYQRGAKLSSLSAQVSDPTVSFTNEGANRAWFEAASVQSSLQEFAGTRRDMAGADLRRASTYAGNPNDARSNDFVANAVQQAQNDLQAGLDNAAVTGAVAEMYGQKRDIDAALAGADTLKVTFQLSSPQPLGKGYAALIAEYHASAPEGAVRQGVSLKGFSKLDARPRKFSMQQRIPPGATALKGYRIAVYADGQEVATNLSERRAAVSEEEAYDFFLRQHLRRNEGQTRGPSLLPMRPKQELKAAARGVKLPDEIFVKVDKTGALLAVSADRSGESKVSPGCEAFLKNLRFLPALENGTPVEGTARVVLADVWR